MQNEPIPGIQTHPKYRQEKDPNAIFRQASQMQAQKLKDLAEREGLDVGNGEYLYLETRLYSSKRGLIRSSEHDHAEKVKQWKRAKNEFAKGKR